MSTDEILDALNSEVRRITEIQARVHRLTEWALSEGATVRNDTHAPLEVLVTWPDGLGIVASMDTSGGSARLCAKYLSPGLPYSLWRDPADEAIEFFKSVEALQ